MVHDDESCGHAADALLSKGAKTVIITLGARGAFVACDHSQQLIPGFSVEQVDTTAAGDAFNGALAVALAEGVPLFEAVRFANAAGALSVTNMGAQPSAPNRIEIETFLNERTITALDSHSDGYPPTPHMHRPAKSIPAARNC